MLASLCCAFWCPGSASWAEATVSRRCAGTWPPQGSSICTASPMGGHPLPMVALDSAPWHRVHGQWGVRRATEQGLTLSPDSSILHPQVTSNPEGFRILSTLWGSTLCFCPVPNSSSVTPACLNRANPLGHTGRPALTHPRAARQLGTWPPLRSRWCSSLLSHFGTCLVPSVLTLRAGPL